MYSNGGKVALVIMTSLPLALIASIVGVVLAAEAAGLTAETDPLAAGAWLEAGAGLEAGAAWLEEGAAEPEQAVRPKIISMHKPAQIIFFMEISPIVAVL
jgi:hypothetical protein